MATIGHPTALGLSSHAIVPHADPPPRRVDVRLLAPSLVERRGRTADQGVAALARTGRIDPLVDQHDVVAIVRPAAPRRSPVENQRPR